MLSVEFNKIYENILRYILFSFFKMYHLLYLLTIKGKEKKDEKKIVKKIYFSKIFIKY